MKNTKQIFATLLLMIALLCGYNMSAQMCQTAHFDNTTKLSYSGSQPWMTFSGNMTIEAWAKLDTASGVQTILSYNPDKTQAFDVLLISVKSGILTARIANDSLTTAYTDNAWHHIAVIQDITGGNIYLYIDGVNVNSVAYHAHTGTNIVNPTIRIGAYDSTNVAINKWNGNICNVQITTNATILTTAPANFTPDCSVPNQTYYDFYMPLNDIYDTYQSSLNEWDITIYEHVPLNFYDTLSYTHTSPCMPILSYTFNTSTNACGVDTIAIIAHNSNPYASVVTGWGTGSDTIITTNGTYTYHSTCNDSATFHLSACMLAVNDTHIDNVISIYPNPSHGTITINTHSNMNSIVTIIDMYGRVIRTESGSNSIVINNIPAGMYVVSVDNVRTKILIQ